MTQSLQDSSARDIYAEARRVGIRMSEDHARMASGWHDIYSVATDAVREMEYRDHEPAAVFKPVREG